MVLAIGFVIGIRSMHEGSKGEHVVTWAGGVLMVGLGIYGLTGSGARRTAQSGRVSGGYAGMPAPTTVRGARIMSGILLVAGVLALALFATVGP